MRTSRGYHILRDVLGIFGKVWSLEPLFTWREAFRWTLDSELLDVFLNDVNLNEKQENEFDNL